MERYSTRNICIGLPKTFKAEESMMQELNMLSFM